VVTASRDQTARIWSLDPPIRSAAAVSSAREVKRLIGHTNQVVSAAFSPDDTRVVTASIDGTARIWTWNGSSPEMILRHYDAVNSAAFSSNGAWVVTASKDGTARVWSVTDGVERLVLRHGNAVRSATFSPGSRDAQSDPDYVATGSDDGRVRLWRVSLPALVDYAKRASTGCLTADQRVRHLAESAALGHRRFAECERSYDRQPTAE
jgi:WD40 repeat protein